ncbi:MAG: response regulator transcription factor [Candidatus Promineifilaceae bacterium]|nr:response regulator transcription factor [Candidatus Promineifilaceae bacterium]
MSESIRILVADDHPVVRDGLVAILQTQPDFRVVGQAGTGREVVTEAGRLQPEVTLLDLEMPEMDGVEALKQIKQQGSSAGVIVFTAFDTDERILGAVRAGAKGYLLKGAPREEVFNAIRIVNQGGSLLGPAVASKLIDQVASKDERIPELTAREKEVLAALAQGKTNREIAEELVITVRTVKFHVSSILHKLDAANRTEAVSKASQWGLIEL